MLGSQPVNTRLLPQAGSSPSQPLVKHNKLQRERERNRVGKTQTKRRTEVLVSMIIISDDDEDGGGDDGGVAGGDNGDDAGGGNGDGGGTVAT